MIVEPLESRIAPAVIFVVETSTNKLASFDSATPGTLVSDVAITGLQAGEIITAIDFRPATGALYGLGIVDDGATRTGRLYVIDPVSAAATLLGAGPFSATLGDTDRWGFDFNPISDRIRVTNSLDQNFRLNPNDGTLSGPDGNISNGDASEETVSSVAYDRNFGSNFTTLYAYDFQKDSLYTVGGLNGNPPPDSGTLNLIAHATLNGNNFVADSSLIGFDIGGAFGGPDLGWLGIRKTGGTGAKLYTMDLATAELTDLGAIGDGTRVFGGLSVQTDAPAPSISVDGRTATWTDLDGDAVTLKITKGELTPANFRFFAGANGSAALAKLTLTDSAFTGTNVTITAKRGSNGGDGRVNVGEINATGVDLGVVTIAGDLVAIDAGQAAAPAPSIKSLTVASMAAFGTKQLVSLAGFGSNLADGAGKITIAGDFAGNLNPGESKTGMITIGGDVRDAGIGFSGYIGHFGAGTVGKVVIKGSVRGGDFAETGKVLLSGVSSTFIGGSIVGGDADASGRISISGSAKATITLVGSLFGSNGMNSGTIDSFGGVASVKIGGSIFGGSGDSSGKLSALGAVSISIKYDVIGGSGANTGSIVGGTTPTSILKSVVIGGSMISESSATRISATRIGSVTIKGDVSGNTIAPVNIFGFGLMPPNNALESIAIGKVTIGGDLKFAGIFAGVNTGFSGVTADAAIGSVKIAGNMIGSSITAGIVPTNGRYGDADDAFAGGNAGSPEIFAKIASITIGGQLIGTIGGLVDSFGILAEQIGAISVAKIKLPLTANKDDFTFSVSGDVRVREL